MCSCSSSGYIWRHFCVIFGTLGLHLGTFLGTLGTFFSTFGLLGRPWDPLWAPLGARGEKVRKTTPFYNEKLVNFEYLFCIFSQKTCFLKRRFPDRFFYRFLTPPGPSQTLKIKQNHCSVARNQGFSKIKKGALGEAFWLDFKALLEHFFDIFVICCVFFCGSIF